jgi:hypothetical protein
MALFDRQLVELKAFAPDTAIKATYAELEGLWSGYKTQLVGQAPRRDNAAALIELDAQVLALAHKGTLQFEQLSGKPAGKLVNLAGRQRMLSQRVAKFYLVQAWKLPAANTESELEKARSEFVAALDSLAQAPEASPSIQQELALARHQWVFFESALGQRHTTNTLPDTLRAERSANVLVSSENILSVMDKVTGLFARQAA